MMSSIETYAQLEQRFAAWSLTQPPIAAVIVVGSRARLEHPADEWSDLDLVVFASDTASYLHDAAWLNTFGILVAAISNSFGQNDREWIALYADGSKLDGAWLSIDPATPSTLQAMVDTFPYPNVLQRGARVLIDKTGSQREPRWPKIEMPKSPNQADLAALINRVWLDAVKAAKFIRRQDLWRAKQLCDCEIKRHLLTLLEWHAAIQQSQRDIWYDGRFLNEWVEPQALADLPATFAAYEAADLRRALFATLDLIRRLARDVARQLDYAYPEHIDQFADNYIHALL